ncbi:PE-PPE domain-containing protein [Streptomyces sp. uw30]|uniref:PE-PPE domain-containing protein n=1 Tax=Streptomyces sp. uw30 TaxID=1828179 RepID=UPI0011CE021C|nr:PE-PPE domain-containing protein [Streptomyces sp. uw30]TXS35379.1 PE-PPE domain-containing protein [Streptomyces sp. uw30]
MPKTDRLARRAKTVAVTAVMTAVAALTPTVAQADEAPHHYYIELGGTGTALPAPDCTGTFYFANQHLEEGAEAVRVCYPASAGPWLNGHNAPDLTAQSYDSSVAEGYRNLLAAVERTHRENPTARLTVVGYSQGAQAADAVLETIANGGTDIPRELVDGKLYADPKQPDTGMWAKVPKGLGAFGFTSAGPGPREFPGVPVARFCIRGDLACDATTPVAAFDFFLTDKHARYVLDGNVMARTIAQDGLNGVYWTES